MNSNESRTRARTWSTRPSWCGRHTAWRAALASAVLLASAACARAPSTLGSASQPAHQLTVLQWWLIGISFAVMLIIGVLIVVPLRHRIRTVADAPLTGGGSTTPIAVGVAISALILLAVFVYSAVVLADDAKPDTTPQLAVKVTGHRWWWEVEYLNADSSNVQGQVVGANEIHIPVGEPVRILGTSADVIHDFWVPQLQGKIDLIPGRTNVFWIRADKPGRYRGQCAEYCGLQHAHMIFWVVAQSRPDFDAWLAHARQPAPAPTTPLEKQGEQAFLSAPCVVCHTVRGTGAGGKLGPDLTHIGGRLTIGAGTLTNTPGNLAGWIENAQSIKPGVDMPRLDLPPATLHKILAYLESLN